MTLGQTQIETKLRQNCFSLCDKFNNLPRLKTIAFVGAYDAIIGGTHTDSQRLTSVLQYLVGAGFPVDPDFDVDVVNFREGRDFLLEDKPADIVFVSYILSGVNPFLPKFRPGIRDCLSEVDWCTVVSRKNHEVGWFDRIESAQAKLIVTYGGNIEIQSQIFSDEYGLDFAVLIPSPDEECCQRHIPEERIKDLYPTIKNIDLPQAWLGFSADKKYLQSVQPALNTKTSIGQQAQRVLSLE